MCKCFVRRIETTDSVTGGKSFDLGLQITDMDFDCGVGSSTKKEMKMKMNGVHSKVAKPRM